MRATAASIAASYWIGPSTSSDGRALAHHRGRLDHLVDVGARARRAGRVGQHRHPRLDPERRGRARRGQRDVGELGSGRVGVDRAVAVDQHLVAQAHEEHRRDHRDVGQPCAPPRAPAGSCGRWCARRPDTMPSASPSSTIMVPKYDTSMTMSRARSRSMPLCLRRSWYAAANRPRSSGSVGLSSRAADDVDAQQGGPLLDLAGLAQDREVGDPAAQHGVGGLEDAVVVALGQHDVPPVADGQVDELVLEHQRRHRSRAGHLEPVEQDVAVDPLVEQRQCGRHLAGRLLLQPAAHRRQGLGGVAGVERRRHDRHRRAQTVDQPAHLLGQLEPAVEHDAGHLREVRAHLGRQHAEHDLGPVARRDHHRTVEEPVEHVRQRHRGDHKRRWSPARAATPRR